MRKFCVPHMVLHTLECTWYNCFVKVKYNRIKFLKSYMVPVYVVVVGGVVWTSMASRTPTGRREAARSWPVRGRAIRIHPWPTEATHSILYRCKPVKF